ncbi:MAG: HD domain-containing protein, partial [Limisphaerales bacterium]
MNMRARAEHLVSLIPRDIPGLTVHDVTHLDALWETASLIAGENYPINPAEAFVFGGAVLLHDSAMSLAAYPGGINELKTTAVWRDAVASRLLAITKGTIDRCQLENPPDEITKAALIDVLRETHATRAQDLPSVKWPSADGTYEFLIQNSDLRSIYGPIIGQIAASHWWPVTKLEQLPDRVNAGGNIPGGWHVNPLKVACLLRVADAAHIDARRAPRFLRAIVKPNRSSDVHWAFQTKVGKPSIDKNFLVYTGGPFDVTEAEAWWLGYDLLSTIDDELRAVHGALDSRNLHSFAATAVKGAKSPQVIARHIQTKGWQPVNTELKVSDIPSLVEMLGGERLYGTDLSAPVRELIQNAADALQAKQLVSPTAKIGVIKVRLRRDDGADFLVFEDDGVGMSTRVLTEALLDFGRSFWRSGLLRQEFPGLLSKGLKTTGRFG